MNVLPALCTDLIYHMYLCILVVPCSSEKALMHSFLHRLATHTGDIHGPNACLDGKGRQAASL